jgi:hypothetical protein
VTYAFCMADDPSKPEDKQRIEVLEEQVAHLRSQLPPDDSADAEGVVMPNRTKVIILAALAGLLALAAVIALVSGMSRVIVPVSKNAAKSLAPFEKDPTQPAPQPRPKKQQPPPEDLPRAPGL